MGDHQDRRAVALAQPRHKPHELLSALVVLTDGGLVEHQEVRLQHQHGRDAQAAALAEAQAEGGAVTVAIEIDDPEHVVDAPSDFVCRIVADLEAIGDLLVHLVRHELVVGILEHVANVGRDLAGAELGEILATKVDRAGRCCVDPNQHARQRGLARTVLAESATSRRTQARD